MPLAVRNHVFERTPNNRVRDVSFYKCTRCSETVRISARSNRPLEEKVAEAVKHDCAGILATPKDDPEARAIFLLRQLVELHKTKFPEPTPAVTEAEEFLASYGRERFS